ncbi:MAG: branched-chain amino acid aminotransferase [Proteobacteria bacterium]|nr:branched-chain amino acid aminotransferase [Pseudomonadota bacterium]
MDTYYIDGKFVKENEAVISVKDMIVLRGYGAFDFLRTYDGKPFYLDDHIQRLENSARLLELDVPWSREEIADIVMQTLARNNHPEYNIRIVVTGGISHDSMTFEGTAKLMVMVTAAHALPSEWYTDGAKIVTNPIERHLPNAKSTTYMPAILALKKARAQGGIEAIYVDQDDRLLEGTTTNLFLFIDDKLVTAREGILPGITRQVLLEILKDEFQIEVRDIKKEELGKAQEAFITASNKEIVPIVQIDDLVLGNKKVGKRTRRIMDIFANYTAEYAKKG